MSDARLTIITTTRPSRLTKTFSLLPDGTMHKSPAGEMTEGRAEVVTVSDLSALSSLLRGLTPAQALVYGVPAESPVTILTKRKWAQLGRPAGTLPRSKEAFSWPSGPGVMFSDHDPTAGAAGLSRDDLVAAIRAAVPGLADARMLWWCSASSYITNADTGERLSGLRGQRLYLMVADASDIPRAGKALQDHLWAAGHGHIEVSSSGSLLERTLLDASVYQTNRFDFAAGAATVAPLVQDRGEPVLIDGAVEVIDTREAIPNPPAEVLARANANRDAAKRAVKGEADEAKEAWIDERVKEMVPPDADEPARNAARIIAARALEHRTLAGDFPLTVVVEGTEEPVTVGECLDDPDRWHGALTLDPLEPDYDGRRAVGKLYLMGSRPNLHSFAHGRSVYHLIRQPARIELVRGRTHDATLATLDIMRREPAVFDFGGALVSVDQSRVWPMDEAGLTHWLGGATQYWKWCKAGDTMVEVDEDPPAKIAKAVLSLGAGRRLKPLKAVVTAPVLRPDGSVLDVEGYDAETGLLLEPADEIIGIPSRPTREAVNGALTTLLHPFSRFPLVGPTDWAVLLSALLSAVVRPAVPTCPAFGFDAPVQGSGKSLLATCVSILATGEPATVWPHTAGRDDEEVRKRLFTALRAGNRVILWDNVTGVLDSASLAAALTSENFTDRVLGQSESNTVPNRAIILLTGNNLSLAGDMPRRVLLCRINPNTDRPFAREFDLNPAAYTMAHRQDMVAAALILVRGYLTSGAARAPGRMASFEQWDDFVRQTVAWIDREVAPGQFGDPMEAVTNAQEADPEQDALSALLGGIRAKWPGEWVTARNLVEVVKKANDPNTAAYLTDEEKDIVEALNDLAPRAGMSSRSLGRVLHFRRDRIVGGMRLVQGTSMNVACWKVEDAA